MQDLIGRTIGHYRIVEHLGGGGMGVVYKAEDTKLGRTVALKFLPPEWSRDPDARERFLREARAASALEDSRICTVHDIDETEDGQLFIAMAFYEGETLKKRLERGRLPIGEALDIAIHVAEGLESAHSAEIIHRDIKPANLMLTGHDEVVIIDFGLAKLAGALSLTKSGSSMGTPLYMSPEQSSGERPDARTDLWSLGVVLYEMLTGRPPFVAENHTAVARAILDDNPPPLDVLRPGTPIALDEVLSRLLEKEPDRRYQSAGELTTDLRHLRKGIAEIEGTTLSTPSVMSQRRRPVFPVLLATGLVVAAAAVTIWLTQRSNSPQQTEGPPPRIVVLPFENLGPLEDEYFADGITEEITSRLAAVGGLQVISRTSAMYYKGRQTPLQQIGDELEVEYVLEGTIRWDRSGPGHGRVRITPQLIRVANDSHLWSDRYDRVIEDIFTVQSDIAEQVLARLQTVLLEPEQRVSRAPITESIEAYQAYLLGTQYLGVGGYERNARLAVEMFERAVRMDPKFAVAHATLSEAHSNMYLLKLDFTPERLQMAKASAERALELQPGLPEGHRALGYYHYRGFRDYDRAREHFSLALEGLPNDEIALAGVYAVNKRQGRWDEAIKHLERCARVDPKNWISATEGVVVQRLLRRYAEAETEMRRAISIAPDNVDVYYLGASNYVLWDGATDRARRLLESAPSIESARITYLSILLDLYDRAPDAGLKRLEEVRLESLSDQDWFIPTKLLECMCLSEREEIDSVRAACRSAVELLEREISARPQDHRLYSALGRALALIDRPEEARRAGEYAVELMPISYDAILGQQQAIELAKIYSRIGELDKAMNMIEELLSIPSEISVPLLRLDPVWDPLRDHPRLQALLEEYGEDST